MDEQSPYEVLDVSPNATFEEIADAYDRIMAYLGVESLAMYSMLAEVDTRSQRSAVEEAYRVLSDPDRRSAYDRTRQAAYPDLLVPARTGDSTLSTDMRATKRNTALQHIRIDTTTPTVPESTDTFDDTLAPTTENDPGLPIPPVGPATILAERVPRQARRFEPTIELPELSDESELSGAELKRLRQSASASIEDIAALTKIGKRYVQAIEDNDFDSLPAPVYVRGFVGEYARALGLDPNVVATCYLRLYRRYRGESSKCD